MTRKPTTSSSSQSDASTLDGSGIPPIGIVGRVRQMARSAALIGLAAAAVALSAAPAAAQSVPSTAPVEQLYAGSLWCTLSIDDVTGFVPPAFDGKLFSLTGQFAKNRDAVIRFHGFQATTLAAISTASIEIAMTHRGWVDDTIALEYSVDGWHTARTLTTFSASNRIASSLTTYRFGGLEAVITTPALARSVEVRLRAVSHTGKADQLSLTFDQVRLVVS